MGRTKTLVEVPIQHTRCWSCTHLEKTAYENGSGSFVEAYKCPQNIRLPNTLPPHFAEKCRSFKPKSERGNQNET